MIPTYWRLKTREMALVMVGKPSRKPRSTPRPSGGDSPPGNRPRSARHPMPPPHKLHQKSLMSTTQSEDKQPF